MSRDGRSGNYIHQTDLITPERPFAARCGARVDEEAARNHIPQAAGTLFATTSYAERSRDEPTRDIAQVVSVHPRGLPGSGNTQACAAA